METFRKYSASAKLQPLWVALFLFAFAVLAAIYSLVVPPFEAPDEVGHFYYIAHLIRTHTLPHQINSNSGEAHQPPLYYWIASLPASFADLTDNTGAFRPNPEFSGGGRPGPNVNIGLHGSADRYPYRGQVLALHLARGASILMGAASVAVILLLGWSLFPKLPVIGWLAAGLTAFNPQFLFLSGSINNDNLLILVASLAWLQVVRTVQQPERDRIVLNELPKIFRTQFKSFWGVFGWTNVSPPDWYFGIIIAMLILGIAGWVIAVLRRPDRAFDSAQNRHLVWLLGKGLPRR